MCLQQTALILEDIGLFWTSSHNPDNLMPFVAGYLIKVSFPRCCFGIPNVSSLSTQGTLTLTLDVKRSAILDTLYNHQVSISPSRNLLICIHSQKPS